MGPVLHLQSHGTCPTLVENLEANGGDPIINDSGANPATGALTVYGYNLAGSSIKINTPPRWARARNAPQR